MTSDDVVFTATVDLDTDWTARVTAYADGTVSLAVDEGVLSPDAAVQLALALSAAAYAAQTA